MTELPANVTPTPYDEWYSKAYPDSAVMLGCRRLCIEAWNAAQAAAFEECAVIAEKWRRKPELKIRSHPEDAAMWYAARCIAAAIRSRGEGEN